MTPMHMDVDSVGFYIYYDRYVTDVTDTLYVYITTQALQLMFSAPWATRPIRLFTCAITAPRTIRTVLFRST